MRRLVPILIAMLFGGMLVAPPVTAQDTGTPEPGNMEAESAFAHGVGQPAILYSDRGGEIAIFTVTDVERGWADYDQYSAPEAGKEYIAVSLSISMQSRGSLAINPYSFSMFDGYGVMNQIAWVQPVAGKEHSILIEEQQVASGETANFTVIFQVYEDAPLAVFIWQPDYQTGVMVDISDEG